MLFVLKKVNFLACFLGDSGLFRIKSYELLYEFGTIGRATRDLTMTGSNVYTVHQREIILFSDT